MNPTEKSTYLVVFSLSPGSPDVECVVECEAGQYNRDIIVLQAFSMAVAKEGIYAEEVTDVNVIPKTFLGEEVDFTDPDKCFVLNTPGLIEVTIQE